MTDPTTPTDQPSELSAIRARVEEIVKSLDGINHNPKYFNDYVSKYQGAVRALAGFSRRLLELLDERDAIIEHEQFISASLEATYDTMKARNVKHSSEIERLQKLLDERGHAYDAGLIDGAAAMNDSIDSLMAQIKSLRRELAEAREMLCYHFDWDDEDVEGNMKIAKETANFKKWRFLKQPNQKDTQ